LDLVRAFAGFFAGEEGPTGRDGVVRDGQTQPYGQTCNTQDRQDGRPALWAIKRETEQALSFGVPYRSIQDPQDPDRQILGPGHSQP
jgi:hypothetical protein